MENWKSWTFRCTLLNVLVFGLLSVNYLCFCCYLISELAFCTFVASVGMWERSGLGDINSGRFELTACHNFPPIPPTFQGSCFLALLLLQNIMHYSPSNTSVGHSHLTQYVTATGIYLMGLCYLFLGLL